MKKQDIKVRINNDAEAKEVRNILLDAGDKIDNNFPYNNGYWLIFYAEAKDWMFAKSPRNLSIRYEISISQLREMLKPKQTVTIEVNAHDLPAIERVLLELSKARGKHSKKYNTMSWFQMGSYLSEENLEVLQAINDRRTDNDAKIEVAQTAAVCLRILSGV